MDLRLAALIGTGSVLAAASGFGASTALSQEPSEPTRTVTVNIGTGEQGPAGPAGPAGPSGPPGGQTCPAGFSNGVLVLNAPGGQVSLATCLGDE